MTGVRRKSKELGYRITAWDWDRCKIRQELRRDDLIDGKSMVIQSRTHARQLLGLECIYACVDFFQFYTFFREGIRIIQRRSNTQHWQPGERTLYPIRKQR